MNRSAKQLLRYGFVGACTNGLAFLCYLILVRLRLTPELSAFLIYLLAATSGYFANYRWAFESHERHDKALPRFIATHVTGAGCQYLIILIIYRLLNQPHEVAQGISLGAVSILLYLMLKYFVFKAT